MIAVGIRLGSVELAHRPLEPLLERLRAPFLPTLESVIDTLGAHLTSRIDELWGDLDFIIDGSRIQTRADARRIAQLYAAAERDEVGGAIDPDAYHGRGPWLRSMISVNP